MKTLVIAEKASQARDIRAAVGDRHGPVLPAEGHLLRLAEPEEVDPAWRRWSFALLKPEGLYPTRPRRQADQVFNLSLTRAATRALVPAGARGVIGVGRVKTPTLAIVCRRELEIRAFRPEDYFEVVATAAVAGGSFELRHAPPPARR